MDEIRKGRIDQNSECARHLLELEYFISRNYKHDMKLVKACHKTIKVRDSIRNAGNWTNLYTLLRSCFYILVGANTKGLVYSMIGLHLNLYLS